MASPEHGLRRVVIERKNTVVAYSEFWHASHVMREIANERPKGRRWSLLASLMYAAFTFEAYLNHVGAQIDPLWANYERLDFKAKHSHIERLVALERGDWGMPPLQTVATLFRDVRNVVGHGRTTVLTDPQPLIKFLGPDDDPFSEWQMTAWQELTSDQTFLVEAHSAISAALERIQAKRPEPKEGLFVLGYAIGSARYEPTSNN